MINQKQRDKIIFENSVAPYGGGIARFESISLQKAEQLIALNFIDPEVRQNNSHSVREFLDFSKKLSKEHPKIAKQIYFHGYVVDSNRHDCRTCFEGMGIERGTQDITPEIKNKLKLQFRGADDIQFDSGEFWCWYD